MKHKKKLIFLIIVILLIGGGIYYSKTKKTKVEYTTATVERDNLYQTVSVTGKIAPENQIDLAFKVSGRIEAMYVDIGDAVKKGQKIAVVDKGILDEQLIAAKKELSVQRNALYNMKNREKTYNWAQKDAQRALIKKAQADVDAILEQIGETVLYAPIDGIVVTRNVNVGETTVANAVTANTSVVTIAEAGHLELQANVPESDIIKIALGQKADVTLDAFNAEDIFEAEVKEIEPASTVIQDVVYYKVKLTFPNYDERFKNGMSADINIHTDEKNSVLFIPERAVKNDEEGKYVDVLKDKKNNITEKKYVQTGLRGDDGMIEIASGLSEGEEVISISKTE